MPRSIPSPLRRRNGPVFASPASISRLLANFCGKFSLQLLRRNFFRSAGATACIFVVYFSHFCNKTKYMVNMFRTTPPPLKPARQIVPNFCPSLPVFPSKNFLQIFSNKTQLKLKLIHHCLKRTESILLLPYRRKRNKTTRDGSSLSPCGNCRCTGDVSTKTAVLVT